MKKSVLIGVLAALMLLAFVACENSPVQNYKMLTGITAEGDGYYLEGETPSVSDFTFHKVYSDYSKEVLTDVENIKMGKVGTPNAGKASVSFTYNDLDVTNGSVSVNAITADDIVADSFKVDASEAKVNYFAQLASSKDEYKKLSKTGLTATFQYTNEDDEKVTKTVDDSVLTITTTEIGTAVGPKDVTVQLGSLTTITDTYKVTVNANGVKSMEADINPDYVYYVGGTGLSKDDVKVNLVYDSGEKVAAVESTDVRFDAAIGGSYATTSVANLTPNKDNVPTYLFYAKYVNTTPNYSESIKGEIAPIPMSVPVREKVVESISATTTATLKIGAKISTLGSNITVTPTMSDDKAGTALTYNQTGSDDTTFKIVNPDTTFTEAQGYAANNWVKVTVSTNGTGKTATLSVKLAE